MLDRSGSESRVDLDQLTGQGGIGEVIGCEATSHRADQLIGIISQVFSSLEEERGCEGVVFDGAGTSNGMGDGRLSRPCGAGEDENVLCGVLSCQELDSLGQN